MNQKLELSTMALEALATTLLNLEAKEEEDKKTDGSYDHGEKAA